VPVHFGKLTLVGVGLLGGSVGLAAKQRRLAAHVCGLVRRAAAVAAVSYTHLTLPTSP
jgi:prephenate dehydrogenase